ADANDGRIDFNTIYRSHIMTDCFFYVRATTCAQDQHIRRMDERIRQAIVVLAHAEKIDQALEGGYLSCFWQYRCIICFGESLLKAGIDIELIAEMLGLTFPDILRGQNYFGFLDPAVWRPGRLSVQDARIPTKRDCCKHSYQRQPHRLNQLLNVVENQ